MKILLVKLQQIIKMTAVTITLRPGTSVKIYLERCFHGHWFGDGSAQQWLPRSPEFNTLGLYALGM
jgi:hypothetical protein